MFNNILKLKKKNVWSDITSDITSYNTKRMTYENVEKQPKIKNWLLQTVENYFGKFCQNAENCVFNTQRLFCVKNDKEKKSVHKCNHLSNSFKHIVLKTSIFSIYHSNQI
jgi:hypothetical protein